MLIQTRASSTYSELLAKIKDANLLEKTPKYYITVFTIISVLSVLTWGGVIWVGLATTGFWQLFVLPLIVLQGALTAQYAFIGHELAHNQVFKKHKHNTFYGLIIANLFAGLSYGFWLSKHNRHHGKPNMVGSDPDIDLRIIAFSTEQKYKKPATERLLTSNQGWMFPILVLFTAFDLLLDSFKSLGRSSGRGVHLRWVEGAMLLVRLGVPLAVYFVFFDWWIAPVIWMGYMLSFGGLLGTAFAVNHIGMPLVEKNSRIGFLERQVLTSRNIKPSFVKDIMLGGLNYQIEHHLFPSMARPQLAKARLIVKAFCEEKNIPYKEQSFKQGFAEVVTYLQKVGVSTKIDPFVCPLIAQYRQG